MSWRWFHLDGQGRQEAQEEQAASWKRIQDIEAKSLERVAESGESTTSTIIASLGFERFRPVGTEPPDMHRMVLKERNDSAGP